MLFANLLRHRTGHSRRSFHRLLGRRLELELLEARNLLDGGLTNVLVNNPALDTTAQDTQSETAIVLGAGSNIVVAYNDDGVFSVANLARTGHSMSANGGATFADQGSLPLNHDQGDPVLARSSKTGTIFLSTGGVDSAYVNPTPPPPIVLVGSEQVNVFRSTNNGAAFNNPVNGTPGFVANVDTMDKPWIAVDNFPGPGYGNVYLATFHQSGVYPAWNFDILLSRSTDDGLTWGPSGGTVITSTNVQPTFEGPNVAVGPDHAVYVSWYDDTKGLFNSFNAEILMRKSIDQGVKFSDPVTVTGLRTPYLNGDLLLTDSSGRIFRSNAFPQAAVNPVTGDIYVAYDDRAKNNWRSSYSTTGGPATDKANIYFTQSRDGGQKWSTPVQVNDDLTNNDQWFPALAVTPDGSHVGLFWYDRRLDSADNLIDRFGAIGTVSGHTVSFGANFRITDVSFPPAFGQEPGVFPPYMGDYDQAVADNDYFYTTWGDNRLADAFHANQPDVRLAKVPVDWLATNPLSATNPATALAPTQSTSALTASFALPLADLSFLWRTNFNAAGWSWLVHPTSAADGAFTTPANQGEQNRMDMLMVLEHDLGHSLGVVHDETGVMEDTLAAGTLKTLSGQWSLQDSALLDLVFAGEQNPLRRRFF